MKKGKYIKQFATAALCTALLVPQTAMAQEAKTTFSDLGVDSDSIVVLYTNDVHGGVSDNEQYSGSANSLGYAGVAALKEEAEKLAAGVALVDCGDAVQGSVVCSESEGADVIEIMNQAGYDYWVFGNHEFDYGMERLLQFPDEFQGDCLAVNFFDLKTEEDLLKPYDIVSYDVNGKEIKVAYLGIMTPENISKGSVSNFQDEDGNYIYGFGGENLDQFYEMIQKNIDAAYDEGADCLVAMGHLGDTGITEGWSSGEVIANTHGITAFLDGHAHSEITEQVCKDAEDNDVLLSSTGTKLSNIGVLVMKSSEDGMVACSSNLVNSLTDSEKQEDAYKETETFVNDIQDKYADLVVVVGNSDYDLYIYNPEDGTRMIRNQETNLGDFVTDAFRYGLEADVAFSNGGNIRADLPKGEITYLDILNVLPWSSNIVKLEVTGQQLLDCLEMGARLWPEECGGFIQASGLTYEIHTYITPSVMTSEDGLFESVDGEYRVKNVYVGEEPLDLEKTYTLAMDEYYYVSDGDGMTMFRDCEALVDVEDHVIDHDLVISYLDSLDGTIPEEYQNVDGQGRIQILEDAEEVDTEEEKELPPVQARVAVGIALILFLGVCIYRLFKKEENA